MQDMMDHHEKRRSSGYALHSYLGTELLATEGISVLPLAKAGTAVHVLLKL